MHAAATVGIHAGIAAGLGLGAGLALGHGSKLANEEHGNGGIPVAMLAGLATIGTMASASSLLNFTGRNLITHHGGAWLGLTALGAAGGYLGYQLLS